MGLNKNVVGDVLNGNVFANARTSQRDVNVSKSGTTGAQITNLRGVRNEATVARICSESPGDSVQSGSECR